MSVLTVTVSSTRKLIAFLFSFGGNHLFKFPIHEILASFFSGYRQISTGYGFFCVFRGKAHISSRGTMMTKRNLESLNRRCQYGLGTLGRANLSFLSDRLHFYSMRCLKGRGWNLSGPVEQLKIMSNMKIAWVLSPCFLLSLVLISGRVFFLI